MKKTLRDFKAFISQGNVLSLAVGVMIGGAFGKIVSSLVSDIFMPLIGLLTGGLDFSGLSIVVGDATLGYGAFITSVIDFFFIAVCVFLFARMVEKLMPKKEVKPTEEPNVCVFCRQPLDADATRCPHCTSFVGASSENQAAFEESTHA